MEKAYELLNNGELLFITSPIEELNGKLITLEKLESIISGWVDIISQDVEKSNVLKLNQLCDVVNGEITKISINNDDLIHEKYPEVGDIDINYHWYGDNNDTTIVERTITLHPYETKKIITKEKQK